MFGTSNGVSANALDVELTGTNTRLLVLSFLMMAGMFFMVIVMVIINILVNQKTIKTQNEKFVETLKAVSQMQTRGASLPIFPALPPVYSATSQMRLVGYIASSTAIPSAPVSENDKKQLNELALKCKEIGLQIDQATGRKNNSKNVAEMVYKIALEMGVSNYEATLFFAIAMVYDIGFLEVDQSLLLAENLSENQKGEIRNHVKQGLALLSFVPKKYVSVFADGVLMHHENMDGSGYPEGLSGDRIPYIARLLHVAESFVSLISHRKYRSIYDKEAALAELKKNSAAYDTNIIDVLDYLI